MQLFIGFLVASLVSIIALKTQSLSKSGAVAAAFLGTIVFGLGGVPWAVLLLGFFISSSILSQIFSSRKKKLEDQFEKGSQRDHMQVIANGGISGIFVLLHLLNPQAVWPWLGFTGTLAAANADTWATELGVLSKGTPRLITTLKPAAKGTSGAITTAGTLASLGGAALIGILAAIFWPVGNKPDALLEGLLIIAIVSLAGLLGSLLDSLLAATVQAIYFCPKCQKETEHHPYHSCGSPTTLQRGLPWLTNDWINTACALFGGAAALLPGILLSFSILW